MMADTGDKTFKSRLNEKGRKIAKKELGEKNDKDRELAVQSLRQWVQQQPWLNTPTDFGFLLRFLRVRKFSQLGARQTLENYWTARSKTPQWFRNIDPADPVMKELLKTGFYFSPKSTDKNGRRLVIERAANLNLDSIIKKHGSIDVVFKAMVLVCEWMNTDETIQTHGLKVLGDLSDANLNLDSIIKKHGSIDVVFKAMVLVCEWMNTDETIQTHGLKVLGDLSDGKMADSMKMWTPENGKKIMAYYQTSLPCRMKGLHFYNEPTFMDVLYAIISPMMKQKTKDRMIFHGKSLAKVYDHIDMSVLPDEYLPDEYSGPRVGPCSQLVDEMINDMQQPEFRDYMCALSSDKYGVDLDAKSKTDVPLNSFRKLNVD